jgi:hypothetical protein
MMMIAGTGRRRKLLLIRGVACRHTTHRNIISQLRRDDYEAKVGIVGPS